MKHIFNKMLALSLIFCLLLSCPVALAEKDTDNLPKLESGATVENETNNESSEQQKEEIPLYEKLGYQEDFVYEDEMIGHALKSTVAYVVQESEFSISYRRFELKNENVAALKEAHPNATPEELAAFILDNHRDFFGYGEPITVYATTGGQGSGVFLGDKGYVATNAHVAGSPSAEELEYSACDLLYNNYFDGEIPLAVQMLSAFGLPITEDAVYDIYYNDYEYYTYEAREVSCKFLKTNMKIYTPTADGQTNPENATVYDAKVIKCGISSDDDAQGLTQDIAILKIDDEDFVGLCLSESYPESNSTIISGGFPAVADEIFQNFSLESTLSVTIGTGKIARQVPIKGTTYKALEITTNISNGSSGGPSVDNHLHVEGLNTYGSNSDKRFAYMVPAEAIIDMADDFEIEQGDVSKTFLAGLQMLQKGYGKAAAQCFREVQQKRASIPYLDNLISLADVAPQETPLKEEPPVEPVVEEPVAEEPPVEPTLEEQQKSAINYKLVNILVVSGIGLLVIIIIVVVFIIIRKKKSNISAGTTDATEENALPPSGAYVAATSNTIQQQNMNEASEQDSDADSFFSPAADLDSDL